MVHWFKKKETLVSKELSFNIQKLREKVVKMSPQIYSAHKEQGFVLIKELLETTKNIRILAVNKLRPDADYQKEYLMNLGAINVLDEVLGTVERMILDEGLKRRTKQEVGTRKYVNNTSKSFASDF